MNIAPQIDRLTDIFDKDIHAHTDNTIGVLNLFLHNNCRIHFLQNGNSLLMVVAKGVRDSIFSPNTASGIVLGAFILAQAFQGISE